MSRLFEFLVACQATGRVPKEVEVAIDCFERGADVDPSQDATVRVTAHKLRRRLAEFYGSGGSPRLSIPRGEYRLTLEAGDPAAGGAIAGAAGWRVLLPRGARERVAGALILLLLAAVGLAVTLALRNAPGQPQLQELRTAALWQPLLEDDLPLQLVLGDYYIFGERDARGNIGRLVRDFDINSRRDLEQRLGTDPPAGGQFVDLGLGYLPTSSAHALRELLPVLAASGKPLMLTLASELDPASLKSTHVIYVGYLSALGMLQDLMVAGSRYSFGGSYDELIDAVTGTAWISEAGGPHGLNVRYRDYAYLAQLQGPGGHRHLLIAGTRDTGLMQAAEVASSPAQLRAIDTQVAGGVPFEALFEVQGLNGINVQSRLIEASIIEP